jgi:prepilin-type N-terminal cleavage/methylation domain-containing protein
MGSCRRIAGFTLLEVLISVLILGLIAFSLERVLATALSSSSATTGKQDVLLQARFAMERMAMFIQETDEIKTPIQSTPEKPCVLQVRERILDTYNNETLVYQPAGDGFIDADKNRDKVIGSADTPKYISYYLENEQLREKMPKYGAPTPDDVPETVICEHVKDFRCSLFSPGLVNIGLTLRKDRTEVTLQTRARARLIE